MQNLDEFKFQLLSLRGENDKKELALINEAFFFWKSIWTAELKKNKASAPNWADEFYRHDYVGVLFNKGIPVSVHLYGLHNLSLNACSQQSYFEKFPKDFATSMEKDDYDRVLSAGWLTINPDFLINEHGVAFSKCMIWLVLRVSKLLGCKASLGPTRSDNGLASKIIEWGAISYGQAEAYNTPIDILVMDNDNQIPLRQNEQNIVNAVWTTQGIETLEADKKAA